MHYCAFAGSRGATIRKAAPARKRKKLYVENMEAAPAAQAERPAQTRKRGRSGDVGFATRDFDDFDMLDAESILQDKLDADEERAFKPDRSAAVEEARVIPEGRELLFTCLIETTEGEQIHGQYRAVS